MKPRGGWRWLAAAAAVALGALWLWHRNDAPTASGDGGSAARPAPQHHEERANAAVRERPSRDRTSRP
ncbi:MAG TPA: hypothetical protein VFZ14_03090 [Burkholderiales bacterium]|nr:hypothetical protein [Burkholderiales bacterium]